MHTSQSKSSKNGKPAGAGESSCASCGDLATSAHAQMMPAYALGQAAPGVSLFGSPIQTKLTVGLPGDPYEQEADSVAQRITSGQPVHSISAVSPGSLKRMAQRQTDEPEEPDELRPADEPEELAQTFPLQREVDDEEEEPAEEPVQPLLIQRQVDDEEEEPAEEPVQPLLIQRQAEDEQEVPAVVDEQPEELPTDELAQASFQKECDCQGPCACNGGSTTADQATNKNQSQEAHQDDRAVVQTSEGTGGGNDSGVVTRAIHQQGGGESFHPEVQEAIETQTGFDMSSVRIHRDETAHNANRSLRARAFTHGTDIWLGPGESPNDLRLMAHEATHVVQQTGSVQRQTRVPPGDERSAPVAIEPASETTPAPEPTAEARASSRRAEVDEAGRSFASMAEQALGLQEGYTERPDRSELGLPPEGAAEQRSAGALSEISATTSQLQTETEAVAAEQPEPPAAELAPTEESQDAVPPEAQPEAVTAEAEASRAPVEGAALPVEEISGPGSESEAALNHLRSAQDVDPSIVILGESINEHITGLRERVAGNALRTAASLQGEAAAQRAAIQGSLGASQATVGGIMEGTRASVADSKATALETLTQQGESAHARNTEGSETQTGRLQENVDGSIEEARTIFTDADREVGETGEREAGRGRDYAHDLARQARELGRSEAARYRRTEEDSDLGDDKAEAVIDVANRFARQLEGDGNNLHSDVLEQTEEARQQVTAEEEPTVTGLEEVGPGAVESIGTFFGSIDDQVDSISEQGEGQLDAAETGALGELDNLDQAAQGRGVALLAQSEANLDAGLTAGLLAQTNLAGQAGQMLNDTGQKSINQLADVATSGATYEDPGEPTMIQLDPIDAGVPLPGGVSADEQDAVVGQLDQMGPTLDQAADSQTMELTHSLGEVTTAASQAGSGWVDETQGRMDGFAGVADAGLTQVTDGTNTQLDSTLAQGETQAIAEVDRISQDVRNNVDQVRQSVDGGVSEATANLRGGVDEGNVHSDETFSELPGEMHEAAEAQESFFGSIGHWFSEQLADTWEAIKGMADWGFILDLAVGIVAAIAVGLLVVGALALIGVTGGLAAALIVGAAAGAAGFAAGQMSANVRHGDPLFQGVGHAAILGAFVGAGGAIAALPSVGLLAGTGVVMLAAGVGTVVANVSTGRDWDEHLLANILIVGIFHAVLKGAMDRVVPRLRGSRGSEPRAGEGEGPGGVRGAAGRVLASLGEKAMTAIRRAFGDVAAFNALVESVKAVTRPTMAMIADIRAYFERMGYSEAPENRVMLDRLERIARGELEPEQVDIDFLQHEMLERGLVDRGIPKGYEEVPGERQVWDPAHDITRTALGVDNVYHPDAIRAAGD